VPPACTKPRRLAAVVAGQRHQTVVEPRPVPKAGSLLSLFSG
jgi:hypothetical protein